MTPSERELFNELVMAASTPKTLIGRMILRSFGGQWYSGIVFKHDNRSEDKYVHIEYHDGDEDSIHISEISDYLVEIDK